MGIGIGKKRLGYDDEALVEMIAEGRLSYGAIGEKLGISESLVKKIALGTRRRDLSRRIWEAEGGVLAEARRAGTRYARHLIMEHVRVGLKGKGDQARRAREFVLRFVRETRPRDKDVPQERMRRPEWMIREERLAGMTPWEDLADAERAREAKEEGLRQQATGPRGEVKAEGSMPAHSVAGARGPVRVPEVPGEGPARGPEGALKCPASVPEVSGKCPIGETP